MTLHKACQDFQVTFNVQAVQKDFTPEFCLSYGDELVKISAVMADCFKTETIHPGVKHISEFLIFHFPVCSGGYQKADLRGLKTGFYHFINNRIEDARFSGIRDRTCIVRNDNNSLGFRIRFQFFMHQGFEGRTVYRIG